MDLLIEVNGKKMTAQRGETILDVLRRNGISIPTLCHIPGLSPTGSCRICVVEVEGRNELLPSCSQRVEDSMSIRTHTPALLAARKSIIEMLLASHKGECLHCSHNGECELQELGAAFQVSQRRFPYTQRHQGRDTSSEGLVFDHNKCILCQRCVRICGDIMGVSALEVAGRGSSTRIATVLDKGLNLSSCIQCGQCTLVCPTGALQVKDSLDSVIRVLSDASSFPVVSISAAAAISVGEALGIRPGKDMTGALSNALRLIGFRKVLDMTAGSGLYLQLTTALLTQRIMEGIATPIFSSCCPAWVQMAGREFQDLPGELSTVRTPSQLMELLAAYSKRDSENNQGFPTAHISVDACAARRLEGSREEADHSGIHGQQHFLNTRDLARLMKLYGIDLQMLPDQALDDPLNVYSYAGKVTAISGGTAELLAYALEERFNGKSSPERKTRKLRSNRWFKEIGLRLNGKEYAIIAINGTGRIREALEQIRQRNDVLFVEVMACPGGCLFGGGQVRIKDEPTAKARLKALTDAQTLHERPALKDAGPLSALLNILNETDKMYLYGRSFRGKEEA